ncbi:MAG: T9SS type A sorting domain-containing protein [Bacteroidales bacterium]|nr:T9SS type A sorting domain-containing protein [Candidatus Latescibacterota bacterium]
MDKTMKIIFPVLLCVIIVAVPSLRAMWIEDGIPICVLADDQLKPTIVSDEEDGAFIAWEDSDSGTGYSAIKVQKINDEGNTEWTEGGIPVFTEYPAADYQYNPAIASNKSGGAIVVWEDLVFGDADIFIQILSASGTPLLPPGEMMILCEASYDQTDARIISYYDGSAIIAWQDENGGHYDIYAQRINSSGTALWAEDGEQVCDAGWDQTELQIVDDRRGGAVVVWQNYHVPGEIDIFAQRIDSMGTTQWSEAPLCVASGLQYEPQIASDGKGGGAIVTWTDDRSGVYTYDIYAQRIDGTGTIIWATDGIALCTAAGNQHTPQIVSDYSGAVSGAIVVWVDTRNGNNDIYAQRIDPSGTIMWAANGVPVCTAAEHQSVFSIKSDGAGGVIVSWHDGRGADYDIYTQWIDASGTAQWPADGLPLCGAAGNQTLPVITSEIFSPAIVAWSDYRNGNYDIYAQAIDSQGRIGYFPPVIESVSDIPGDEGGWVRIFIDRSSWDDAWRYTNPAFLYNVWQRIDNPAMTASIGSSTDDPVELESVSDWPMVEIEGRLFLDSREFVHSGQFPPGTWELLGSFAACQEDGYVYRASTLVDSTESGNPYSVYVVSVHTTVPSIWYMSEPDSGYSVDNLPPVPPVGVIAEQSFDPVGLSLAWDMNIESDFSFYALHRGPSESFVPAPANRVATPGDPEYFDDEWHWDSGYYYKVSAFDSHGNESSFTLIAPGEVTGYDPVVIPTASYLSQNYPNPFNPSTTIKFGLSGSSHVSLKIYDASGRQIRMVIDEDRDPGHYTEVWDGQDGSGRAVASGVYFYRLSTKTFTQNRKMILLR